MRTECDLPAIEIPTPAAWEGSKRPMTRLLPPTSAVRLAWARSGEVVEDEQSKLLLRSIDSILEAVKARAESDQAEREYVLNSLMAIEATLRSLEIIHKGRSLNFDETDKLRDAYLKSVEGTIDFGSKLSDFVSSLPTMAVTATGGVMITALSGSDTSLWVIGVFCALAGYLLKIAFVKKAGGNTRKLYIREDYQRDLYYEHFLQRASEALTALYKELSCIHRRAFGAPYPAEAEAKQVLDGILKGLRPTFCELLHKHMREGKVTPELWPVCETGHETAVSECPFWKKESRERS